VEYTEGSLNQKRKMIKKVLLDMDGVVADFSKLALELLGHEDLYDKPDEFDYEAQMIHHMLGISNTEFWKRIKGDKNFWVNIPPTPEFSFIISALDNTVGLKNVCICTTPSMWKKGECVEGKITWIERWIPSLRPRIIFTSTKEFAASPTTVLIDDLDSNIKKFRRAGGKGILVPRPWNSKGELFYNVFRPSPNLIFEYIKNLIDLENS
jgi:hypothetical protein